MRKLFIALLLPFSMLWACVPLFDRCVVFLNKPDVMLKPVPQKIVHSLQSQIDADEVVIGREGGIVSISIVKKPRYKVTSLSSSVDLLPWFKNKKCAQSWEDFHQCMNNKRSPDDEKLYQKLDREFVAKVICEEGSACEDPDFSKWRLRWLIPAKIVLEADIGKGGFETLESAKKSLHAINALLKKVLYGAHFPESFEESEGDAILSINEVPVQPYDFQKSMLHVLERLKETGYLKGMPKGDMQAVARLAQGGRKIYFVPKGCGEKSGWNCVSNASRIRFDDRLCPHIELLK
jgi:hypothetical protein